MISISSDDALKYIKNMGNLYVMEADALNYLAENKEVVECWKNEEVIVIASFSQDADFITVLPIAESFSIEELFELITGRYKNPNLLINTQKLSCEFFEKIEGILEAKFKYERTITDYIYAGKEVPERPENIEILTKSDRDVFVACSNEIIMNRPPLPILFDVFVNHKQGEILVAYEGEKIIGYLSFNSVSEYVYDVDYIYVIPEKRRTGVAKKLAMAYVRYASNRQHEAYWSNAKNEASEKTAKACGFVRIRVVRKYVAK